MFYYFSYTILISIIVEGVEINVNNPVVQISDGLLRGEKYTTVELNRPYISFRGIPYAKPPIGNLRFAPPVPNDSWNDTLNATKDKSECVQKSNPVRGDEDCLYINVYVPLIQLDKIPVMVYIHGGTFMNKNSTYKLYGPDYLLDQNILFVSFNYRLGFYGFISSEDLTVPGNNGLRDQILALKWIKNNIAQFGGDPDSVTVFGESAGSASISYLLQSKLTEGLITRAIMQSGTSLCPWTITREAKEIYNQTAQSLGIDVSSSQSILDGLRQINYTELQTTALTEAVKIIALRNPLDGLLFCPVQEPEHPDAVFDGLSHELLKNGNFIKIPTIVGFNSNEAAAAQDELIQSLLANLYLTRYDLKPSSLVPTDMNVSNAILKFFIGAGIHWHYFGILPANLQKADMCNYGTDDLFVRPILETVKLVSKYAPVYLYQFSFEGTLSNVGEREVPGVGHEEDLYYIFRTYNNFTATPNDLLTRKRIVKLWTNFAKFGNPTPEDDSLLDNIKWPLVNLEDNNDNVLYLNIDVNLTIDANPRRTNMTYWAELYKNFGNPPYDTY